jgi:hypothetical protein
MAIITFSGSPDRGSTTTVTLDKTELAAHPTVSGDTYFSDQAVWESVILRYTSTEGNQLSLTVFDANENPPTALMTFFSGARDAFGVVSLTIIDKQQGTLLIPRVDLNVAEFDIDFTAVSYLLAENNDNLTTESGDRLILE